MNLNLASYLLSIMCAASVFGRVMPGLVADKIGRYNTLLAEGIASGILLLCWPAITSSASIIVFAVLYGFSSGGIISLMSPCIAQITPHVNQFGTYLGMAMAIFGIAGLVGTPICGALIQLHDSYTSASIFSGVVMLSGTLFDCGCPLSAGLQSSGKSLTQPMSFHIIDGQPNAAIQS